MTLGMKLIDIRKKIKDKRNFPNEISVLLGIVLPILQELNWDIFDTRVVRLEGPTGRGKINFALCERGSPKVFIEVKGVGSVTEVAVKQAMRYARRPRAPIGVLTDGRTWSFYLPLEEGSYGEKWVFELDLSEHSSQESSKVLQRYLEKSRVVSGRAHKSALGDRRHAV